MRSFNTKKHFSYKDLLFRSSILIVTIAIIVYFLPTESKFNYQFEINKPWKYGLLQASFDFPIYKEDAEFQKEQDSLMKSFMPYYDLDKEVANKMINKFKNDYKAHLSAVIANDIYKDYIIKTLTEIYRTGVIGPNDMEQLNTDSIRNILIVNNNTSIIVDINNIFTYKTAYEKIINIDTLLYSKNLLQCCNLNNYIIPNLTYNLNKSETSKQDMLSNLSWANGFVMNGQKIIDRGEIIDSQTYSILRSLEKEWDKRSETATGKRLTLIGQILFVFIIILCFMIYLEVFRSEYYEKKRCLSLLFIIIVSFSVATSLMVEHAVMNVYILPFAMIPMLIRIFLDSRTAFLAHVITILLCSISLRTPHEFILLQTIAGMIGIYSLRELSQRSQLLQSAVAVVIAYSITYLGLDLIHVNNVSQLSTYMYINFIINGFLLLFTYPLLFVLEKAFGFTSNVTLVELSNINNKLMRSMSEVAPGTFQHSLQLANLTAAAANSIGANSQLVRTGAMYHDIGKMLNPAFFTENQSGINPHNQLSYKQSAQIVISHITDGLKLADKYNLPQVIKDFISTHHGAGLTQYFYISYQNEHPDEEVDQEIFRYPGPNPFTKEQAILMMADSVEAASRSLPEYTEESISGLVDKIIDKQEQAGYFKECPITFKDISTIKVVFKEKLKTMYHTRISYPELKK